jgi:hypothetical protein
MFIIYTGCTEKLYYQFHHPQRDTCRNHKGSEWLRRTGNCDGGRQKRCGCVDKTTSVNVDTEGLID